MAKGGYRPNSGPMKGAKYKPRIPKDGAVKAEKPAKHPLDTDQDKIRQMLALGTKVRAKMYQEFLQRVGKGEKLTIAEKNMMDRLAVELTAEVNRENEVLPSGKIETPLEFMLRIMNDPNQEEGTRLRAASLAAPFIHARAGEDGKKDQKAEKAKVAGQGRFAAGKAPLALVK